MRPFLAVTPSRLAGRLILANGQKSNILASSSSLVRMASSNSDGGYRIEADTFGKF